MHRFLSLVSILCIGACLASASAHAGLVGDTIHMTLEYQANPSTSPMIEEDGSGPVDDTLVIPQSGASIILFYYAAYNDYVQVTMADTSITFAEVNGVSTTFGPATFNGFVCDDLTKPFTGATLVDAGYPGLSFDPSNAYIVDGKLYLDFSNVAIEQGFPITFSVATDAVSSDPMGTPVPEPTSLVLLGMGVLSLFGLRQRGGSPQAMA